MAKSVWLVEWKPPPGRPWAPLELGPCYESRDEAEGSIPFAETDYRARRYIPAPVAPKRKPAPARAKKGR